MLPTSPKVNNHLTLLDTWPKTLSANVRMTKGLTQYSAFMGLYVPNQKENDKCVMSRSKSSWNGILSCPGNSVNVRGSLGNVVKCSAVFSWRTHLVQVLSGAAVYLFVLSPLGHC